MHLNSEERNRETKESDDERRIRLMNRTPVSYEGSKNSSGPSRNPTVSTNVQLILHACVPISDDTHNHNPVRLKSVMVVRYAKFAKSKCLFPLAISYRAAFVQTRAKHRALSILSRWMITMESQRVIRAARIVAFKRER